jgi:hypothetical protein
VNLDRALALLVQVVVIVILVALAFYVIDRLT